MAHPRSDRLSKPATPPGPQANAPRRAEATPPEGKPQPSRAAISRANEIVRAIGLRPITGLSGPKIGY